MNLLNKIYSLFNSIRERVMLQRIKSVYMH